MKASIEVGVYQDNEDGKAQLSSKHYAVLMQYGQFGGDSDRCYSLEELEWTLRKFEQECLNRGMNEIEIINWTSLNILGFFCGQLLEGKDLKDEKRSNENMED